jgi:hypothetical protein
MSAFEGSFRDEFIERYGAVEQSDGSYVDRFAATSWYNEEGSLHREEGPSCILTNGTVYWCLNGLTYPSFDAWCEKLNKTDEDKMMLRLQYG